MRSSLKTPVLFLTVIFVFAQLAHTNAQEAEKRNEIHCTACQTANPADSKFCGECGQSLEVFPKSQYDVVVLQNHEKQANARKAAQDSLEAKVLFEVAGHLMAQGQYDLASSYYHRIVEKYPNSFYTKASILMEKECYRLSEQSRKTKESTPKKNNGSAFGGAFLGAVLAPLAILAIVSAAY